MSIAAFLFAGFKALAAIPQLISVCEELAGAISIWYITRQNNATLSMISDAAALAARATNDDERYVAAEAWKAALSRPRSSP